MATEPAPAPAPKRSLFNKPKWATPSSTTSAATTTISPDDLFSRKSALPSLLKENEERRRRKVEKQRKEKERERRKSHREEEERASGAEASEKRRRISEEDYKRYGLVSPAKRTQQEAEEAAKGGDDEDAVVKGKHKAKDRKKQPVTLDEDEEQDLPSTVDMKPTRISPRGKKQETITLSDNDSPNDDAELYTRSPKLVPDPVPASPSPDSDDEFTELAALARERRRKREQEASHTPGGGGASTPAPTVFDPVIKVLVTSPIKDTKPLLVHRKLSQRFQEIRTVWCQKQGFDEETSSKIFLIFKMRKLYDVTTCKSLGIKVDAEGTVLGSAGLGDDDEEGRVHVVAVTEEAFVEMKRKRDEARNVHLNVEEEGAVEEEKTETVEEVKKIKLLLKAKGYPDYKLIVRPTTTFDRIASAFKREYKIAEDTEVALVQDGDALPMDDKVQDTDIEDMDCLEVHIK
ncbi:hypothetical protein BDZ85DRAFT_250927 [Elsinoe ampelina]|uniref:Rad60/SUMO-like domain-containing protein n=1 Tax=Elsinoe ampelina TaxID=302913 RepID=A0A6A6G924_9PEZI|nr:hypothetical protein BDZ85DRAFT_250927 [Elsinoe ampelina]